MTEQLATAPPTVLVDEFLEQLQELVALDTVSPLDERQLAAAERLLAGYGCSRVGGSLFGRGDSDSATWVYCHLDTKPPVPREAWVTDPFRLTRIGDRLYGLGVSDSKCQLLNALHATPETGFFLIVDTAEECAGIAAGELMGGRDIDTLVVVDGAIEAFDIYNGLSGQVDGVLMLETGRMCLHPGRERTGVEAGAPTMLDVLAELCNDVAGRSWRFNVTGLSAPVTERSLTLERVEVRFDLRFGVRDLPSVRAFLSERECRVRQFIEPVEGRERFEATSVASGGLAPFSSNVGGHGVTPRRLVVVPGAHNDNGAHLPNEFIRVDQLSTHRARLESVLIAIAGQGE